MPRPASISDARAAGKTPYSHCVQWIGTMTKSYFKGAIDEGAVYDHALSPTQVAAHYQAAGY